MSEDTNHHGAKAEQLVPALGDKGARRYRIFNVDFDSRPLTLLNKPNEAWTKVACELWEARHAQLIASLSEEFGSQSLDRKVQDFADFGVKPFSIVAHHNAMFDHVRTAFVGGAYYAALTGACALGERILNHLMLDLREYYQSTPEYKGVYRKKSFDCWSKVIKVLSAWEVLLPDVRAAFLELEEVRNRSIHFKIETASRLREEALLGAKLLARIISMQFSGFGTQPWFIEDIQGSVFIKRDWEEIPFVAHYYCAKNPFVGPFHSVDLHPEHGWRFMDWSDYSEFSLGDLTDEEFKDLFNNHHPAQRAGSAPTNLAEATD